MKLNRHTPSLVFFSATLTLVLLLTGCGGDDTGGSSTPPTPPPPSPTAPAASTDGSAPSLSGKPAVKEAPTPAADPSGMGTVSEADAKAQADDLAARIKAGEEGTTPDPVEDRGTLILQTAVDSYFNAFQRAPGSFQELVSARYLRGVPAAPAGKKYVLTPEGQVKMENAK